MSSQRLMRGSKGSKVGETEHKQWGSVCVCVGGAGFRACRPFWSKPGEESSLDFGSEWYCLRLECSLTAPMRLSSRSLLAVSKSRAVLEGS